jgi:hypothetical protein
MAEHDPLYPEQESEARRIAASAESAKRVNL